MSLIKVSLMDSMGTDLSVVNAARVSFGKYQNEYDELKDTKLISYLARNGHTSPFGHCFASFHVTAPVFVARQLVKHKFLRWNEVSRRYVSSDPEFYNPVLRHASVDKKQGSGGVLSDWSSHMCDQVIRQSSIEAAKQYTYLLKMGVCEEQARMVLPQNLMTEWYWSGSLDAFADMAKLRLKKDTQGETRMVATQINQEMGCLFPDSWKALVYG